MRRADGFVLELIGKGILLSPEGGRQELPYRKVADLLAALSAEPGRPLGREELSRRLWPDVPRLERQTNLRQALSRIRRLLGDDSISAGRRDCRLNVPVQVVGSPCVGPSSSIPIEEVKLGPGAAIEALSLSDTEASVQLLCNLPGVHPGIESEQLLRIVSNWRNNGPLLPAHRGWAHYCKGIATLRENIGEALPHLRKAMTLAESTHQWNLLSLAAFWFGALQILRGELGSAREMADRTSAKVRYRFPEGAARIESVVAHAILHEGDTETALRRLAFIEARFPHSSHDLRAAQGLRCLYLAYNGQIAEAERLLADLERARDTRGADAEPYSQLAAAVIQTLDYRGYSLARTEDLADGFARQSNLHLELYTRELIAVRALESGKPACRQAQRRRIRTLRNSIGMTQTVWDRKRLTPQAV